MEIREIKSTDHQAIAHFLAYFPIINNRQSEKYWLNCFQTLWETNPFLDGEKKVRGWLLIDQDEVGGCLFQFPSHFQQMPVSAIVSSSSTWFVLEKYRTKSFGLLQKLLQDNKYTILFTTTPSDATLPIIKKMGYQLIPTTLDFLSTMFVDYAQSLEFFLLKKAQNGGFFKIFQNSFLLRLASLGLSPALFLFQKMKLKLPKSGTYEIKIVEKANQDFDRLWERTKNRFAFTAVRNAAMLNWFCNDLNFPKTIIGLYQNSELKGYGIVRYRQAANRFKQIEVLDFWAEDFSLINDFVVFLRNFAKKNKAAFITFPHFHEIIAEKLSAMGLLQVQVGANQYWKIPKDIETVFSAQNLYFTHLQGDYGFA